MPTSPFSTAFVRLPIAGFAALGALDWPMLAQRLRHPEFQEALFLASPALYEEALRLDLDREPDEKSKRVVYSLLKYLSRYATRCTPFGLFGGFSTLPVGNGPTTVQTDTSRPKKVVRLDMNYLCALAQELEKHADIRPHLRFTPNTSLYAVNGQYRYVNYTYNETGMRLHDLSSADQTEYLDAVLNRANNGATPTQLAQAITTDDVLPDEATAFVEQIISLQLLVSELEPALTGDDFLVQIIQTLRAIQAQHPTNALADILAILTEIKADLSRMEQTAPTASTEPYLALEAKLSRLEVPFARKALFQIDTYLPQTTGQLNRGLLNKLVAKIPMLTRLVPSSHTTLDAFRDKFYERYEDEEVPLMLALDPEIGIGFPAGRDAADTSPLVDGVWASGVEAGSRTLTIPKEHTFLLQKVAEAQLSGAYEVVIREEDLRSQEPTPTPLPLTNTAMFSVIRDEGREKLVLHSFGGATGTYLLGRFGHTDPTVLNLLHEISDAEDVLVADAVVFVDLVHLPEARTGNIIIRPQLKTYQIPYLGKTSVDADHEIRVSDLMVSVRSGQIRLRSQSLNRYVMPRLANAHNYANPSSLDIYHFLCAMQYQHVRPSLNNLTGSFASLFLFTPRIALDNLILSEAQWNLRAEHLKPLVAAFKQNHPPTLRAALDAWRTQYRIPRHICLADGDNELYVDLENRWLAEVFVNEIKSCDSIRLVEFLHTPDNAVVHSTGNQHTNQFVVAFQNTPEGSPQRTPGKRKMPVTAPPSSEMAPVRKFFTGSEWLYYKVYTGVKTADWLLAEVLLPLTDSLKAAGQIDKFFFIRYADPNGHFRFRFHLTDPLHLGAVAHEFHAVLAPLVTSKTITSVVADTYNRELERYGAHSIGAVEDYFHIDSEIILRFLSQIEGAEGDECRWRFGMKLTDDLLRQFGMNLPDRIAFVERQASYFGREFGYDTTLKKQLDARYRAIEGAIAELMTEQNDEHTFFYDLARNRTEKLQFVAQYVLTCQRDNLLPLSLEDLLASLIHMSVNRLFRTRQRFVEYSIYYHLHKYYRIEYGRTVLARNQTAQPEVVA